LNNFKNESITTNSLMAFREEMLFLKFTTGQNKEFLIIAPHHKAAKFFLKSSVKTY